MQSQIQDAAYTFQRAVESGEQIVVGVNKFTRDSEPGVPTQRIDQALEQRQVERLQSLRARRDAARWKASLEQLTSAASEGRNLMPVIIDAVESDATVGEIATTLRKVFGEYRESVVM